MEATNDSFAAFITVASFLVVFIGGLVQAMRGGKSLSTALATGYRSMQKLTEQQEAAALAQGGQVAEADTLSQKREDALAAMLTITDVLKETRAELTATRIERQNLRAELAESVAARAELAETRDLQTGQIASLRVDVDKLKTEAQEREAAHAVALAVSQKKIAEQTDIIEHQRATIRALQEYVEQLVPLLKRAGIATDELPKLPPPMSENGGKKNTAEMPAADAKPGD